MSIPNKIHKIDTRESGSAVKFMLWLALLITVICEFVPLLPEMPAANSIDASLAFGLNQAIAQGLFFGKEIIFTFGPYASIYAGTYHPSTDFMMISGSLYLALSYWLCLVLLTKDVQWYWVVFFCATLAGMMYSRDTLLFSLPLLVGLLTFKMLLPEEGGLIRSKLAIFYVVLMFAPFGLLPLIKGSLLIICGAISSLCSALLVIKRHRLLAITCLITPIVSMFFFWIASGQPAANLPSYFSSTAPIISGYTDAMAIDGDIGEVVLYLVASAILLLAICIQTQTTNISKIFLFCIYFVFLFLSFKGGFVRHDGHATISGSSIWIAASLLPFVLNARSALLAISFAIISWFYIYSHHIKTSANDIVDNFKSTYSSGWYGIKNRIENKDWPKSEFDTEVYNIKKQASFPVLQGTTDIYSYSQSYLISSGNTWSPRPILQSYSAYTPALAEINRKHLLGNHAPDNIIFRVEPIDGKIPSIEDGASWPILILNYRPIRMKNGFLFLRREENISGIEEPLKIRSEMHTFGESFLLPRSSQPVFSKIEIKQTLLGRVASFFFKPSQLQITLELNNGVKKQYRIISGMAESGFVISPLIENTDEFGLLYGKDGALDGKMVKSMAIAPRDDKTLLWKDEYSITFSQIKTGTPVRYLKEL